MKKLLTAALALAMLVAPALSQTPVPPAPIAEFNLSECTPRSFTRVHMVETVKDGKTVLLDTDYLVSATESKHNDDQDVWTVEKTEVNTDGTTKITADLTLQDKGVVTLNLVTYKGRAIATIVYQDELRVVFYGGAGKLEDLTKNAEEEHGFCPVLVQLGPDGIMGALEIYLHQDDAPKAPPANVSSTAF